MPDWMSARRFKPAPEQRVLAAAHQRGERVELPFPVRYRKGGWYNARTGAVVDIPVTEWRQATRTDFAPHL